MSNIMAGGRASRFGLTVLALLLAGLIVASPAIAQTDFFVIQNRWSPDDLLNLEADVPQASPASTQSPEAQWLFEPADDARYFRLLNAGTGLYLQNSNGQPVAAPLGAGTEADWSLESVPDVPDPRIQSRAGGYLHTHDGPLVIGDASPNWGESYWRIVPASVAMQPPTGVDSGPGPVVIRRPSVGTYFIPVPIPIPIPVGGPPPFPVCPPGLHLSKGHCCPPLQSWNFMQQSCVLQIKPIACPPGQHLSQGHCCPALQWWNPAQKKCVLQIIVKPIMCPAGQHLSQGHCCPTLQSWNPVQKKCVLQIVKPVLCPAGQHLSQGHCCPTLQSWDPAQNKCVLPVKAPIKTPIIKDAIKVPVCPAGQHMSQGHCCPAGKNWNAAQKKCA
jgi:hypothetical protein